MEVFSVLGKVVELLCVTAGQRCLSAAILHCLSSVAPVAQTDIASQRFHMWSERAVFLLLTSCTLCLDILCLKDFLTLNLISNTVFVFCI